MKVAAIVITLDEEARIKGCLKQLKPYVDYILVLDGGSKDKTVEIASKYADMVNIVFPNNNAANKNYAWGFLPKDIDWVLFADADERWDDYFLKDMKGIIVNHSVLSFKFPRMNLPDLKDFPDYQVRLLKNSGELEWRGDPHDVVYYKGEDKPVDQVNTVILLKHPITHLPRRNDIKRSWW